MNEANARQHVITLQGKYVIASICPDHNSPSFDVIVPGSYIRLENKKPSLKYMGPPYTTDVVECIESFVKSSSYPPDEGWNWYECSLKRVVETYEEAVRYLNQPEQMLLTDNDDSVTCSVHELSVENDNDLFNVPDLTDLQKVTNDDNNVNASQTDDVLMMDSQSNCVDVSSLSAEIVSALTSLTSVISGLRKDISKISEELQETKKVLQLRIRALEFEVKQLLALVTAQERTENKNLFTLGQFKEIYKQFPLPISSQELFLEFNADISNNTSDIAINLKKLIVTNINTKADISDSMTDILKMLVNKDVLSKYVAQRPASGKTPFKNLSLYNLLEVAFTQAYGQFDDPKTITRAIGKVLLNCKDWDGGRLERLKSKEKKKEEENLDKQEDDD